MDLRKQCRTKAPCQTGLPTKDLVTFMRGSAAVRLNDDGFFMSLQRLGQVFSITGKARSRSGVIPWR